METLNQKAHRYAQELELELRAGNTRGALGLVENWSLSRDVRLAVARELDERLGLPEDDDPVLRGRSGFDRARLGTLVEACRRR